MVAADPLNLAVRRGLSSNGTGSYAKAETIPVQAVEDFYLTAKDTLIGTQPAHLIQGDEHFEHTFAHLEGLRGQISSLVAEVFLGHPLRLPIILDDSTLQVRASASASA